jgi:hypothetical protein
MTSTNRTTIPTRVSQCLAAAALMTGLAFGATPIAAASPNDASWDIEEYDQCMKFHNSERMCCEDSGGVMTDRAPNRPPKCVAPPALQSLPGTVAPPIQQTPVQQIEPGQTGPPSTVMTVPRGPAIGRLP